MLTVLAFIVTLGVLITIHEYGHFQVARWAGVKVLRFSIGFGRPLLSRRFGKDGTEFVLAAIPLGGYVKMLDEREGEVSPAERPRAFNQQNVWKRIAIVSAGPIANLLLAILLYWVLFIVGTPGLRPIIGEVPAGSPAAQASMKAEELIVKVGDTPVRTWQDVRWLLLQQTLKSKTAQVEARSDTEESHLHLLDLSDVKTDESDILQQVGLTTFRPPWPARVGEILPDSAAATAGLQVHDEIIAVNGITVSRWEDFTDLVRQNPGKTMTLKLLRDQSTMSLRVMPDIVEEDGKQIGRIGAAYVMTEAETARYMVDVAYAPPEGLLKAIKQTWDTSIFSLKMLGGMITGTVSWKAISGPVTIGSVAGKSADAGWKVFIGFLAIVSISLGVLNLLPIPVLDGGHLLYYTIEIFKGSPVSDATMETGQRIGLALLGLLMACALYNDFNRFITG